MRASLPGKALLCSAALVLLPLFHAATAFGQQETRPAGSIVPARAGVSGAMKETSGGVAALPGIAAIPRPLAVKNAEFGEVRVADGAALHIFSKPGTNLFLSPSNNYSVVNAPMALFPADRDFILTAKVSAVLRNVYDVGALVAYDDERHWAKLCFENSAQKEPTVVSVVTREYSDDSNSSTVDTPYAYLAMARKGEEWSFHFSRDGKEWQLVRHFRMAFGEGARLGFAVHNSRGDGFAATFSEIGYRDRAPRVMRQLEASDLLP